MNNIEEIVIEKNERQRYLLIFMYKKITAMLLFGRSYKALSVINIL